MGRAVRGHEHFAHAEQLLGFAGDIIPGDPDGAEREQYLIQKAQAHATLALASIVADQIVMSHGQDVAGYGR